MTGEVAVERVRGSAAELHGLEVPTDGHRRVWILEVTAPAVVLGSTQRRADIVDEPGVEVVRRRSGGGAVWVEPGDPIWVDVFLPRDDPWWDDDVGRAFLPVGRAWSTALSACGVEGTRVHDGPLLRTRWSDAVCFAGTGPGEVLQGDAKVVGISQRRTRAGSRFQCAVVRDWAPAGLRRALADPPPPGLLEGLGTGVGDLEVDTLIDALVAALA